MQPNKFMQYFRHSHEIHSHATRFPLAEKEREHERSENNNAPAKNFDFVLFGYVYRALQKLNRNSKSKKGQERYEEVYQPKYNQRPYRPENYRPEDNKDANSQYKITSIVKAPEKRSREYARKSYDTFRELRNKLTDLKDKVTQGAKAYNFRKGPASNVARALYAIATGLYNLPVEKGKEEENDAYVKVIGYIGPTGVITRNRSSQDFNLEAELAAQQEMSQGDLEQRLQKAT